MVLPQHIGKDGVKECVELGKPVILLLKADEEIGRIT